MGPSPKFMRGALGVLLRPAQPRVHELLAPGANGGWHIHGRGSDRKTGRRPGQERRRPRRVHLPALRHRRILPVGYTEPLTDETAASAVAFLSRARVFFAAHGITKLTRVVTDNGSCYRSHAFGRAVKGLGARHQRIKPYTPKHNGKVERYQRTLASELLYARPWESEQQRNDAISTWLIHYTYHRPHTATRDQPPASRLETGVTNVMSNYT